MINMKINNFKVREKKANKFILEEDQVKNPILLFFKKNRKSIIVGLIMILLCLILVSIGIGFSLFRGSNDYDITYITGSDKIESNNDPEIDDEDIANDLLGEVSREEGVIILVKSFMTSSGDVVSYYTDGTSILVDAKGRIYRISSNKNGGYGIDEKGKIDDTATKVRVTSETVSLSDGGYITYYSDGSASVELNDVEIFVRDSNNIELSADNTFVKTIPSGVTLSKKATRIDDGLVNVFSDGTVWVNKGNEMFLVNKNAFFKINGGSINYDYENVFSVISEKTYKDGNVIRHYSNGSSTITDSKGNTIYVKNSGDLVLKDKKLYEIIPNDKANSMRTTNCLNGTNVIYFDNGAAIVVDANNDRKYVLDSDDIIYKDKNINSNFDSFGLVSVMMTDDGKKAYSFDNGKTQVINENNSSYIVDTDTLVLVPIVEEKPEEDKKEEKDEGTSHIPVNPGEGIVITDAEYKYNDFKNIQNTMFIVKNKNTKSKKLRIVIEEVSNYSKYNTSRLDPKYVKFQATVGDDYVPATVLADNVWVDSYNDTNYVIYDGILGAKATYNVAISLYVDYSLLDNSHQNKGFIGTIKVYVDDN